MELITQATVDGIEEAFDPKYHLSLQKTQDDFNEKNKFAMSILVHPMQLDKLCTVVQCHYHGGNAQHCWKEILQVVQHRKVLCSNLCMLSL